MQQTNTAKLDHLLNGRIPLDIGHDLRGYRIVKILSAGAFSIVYEAKSPNGESVAIKEFYSRDFSQRNELNQIVCKEGLHKTSKMDGHSSLDSTNVKKINQLSNIEGHHWAQNKAIKEIEILSKINSENIPNHIANFMAYKTHYLVMELYSETPKIDIIGKPMLIEEKFRLLLTSIISLHYRNYIHRDLHPKNILWGKDDNPVLIDFGMAMHYTEDTDEFKIVGSPYSTENYEKSYSFDTDLYAAGAIAYYWLNGKTPPFISQRKQQNILLETSDLNKAINLAMKLRLPSSRSRVDEVIDLIGEDTRVKKVIPQNYSKKQVEGRRYHRYINETIFSQMESYPEVRDII